MFLVPELPLELAEKTENFLLILAEAHLGHFKLVVPAEQSSSNSQWQS